MRLGNSAVFEKKKIFKSDEGPRETQKAPRETRTLMNGPCMGPDRVHNDDIMIW